MATKTSIWGWIILTAVIALLVGGFLGALAFPREEIKYEDKIVEVEVPVIEYVNQTVIETEIVEVPAEVGTNYFLDLAVEDFMIEVDDRKKLQRCDGERYDFDEISIKDIDDEWRFVVSDDEEYIVIFDAKLKYKDEDKCYAWWNVRVIYDEDDINVKTALIE